MLIIAPFLVPLLTALLSYFVKKRYVAVVNIVGGLLFLVAAMLLLSRVLSEGPQSIAMGNWPWHVAIAFIADPMSAMLVLLIALVANASIIFQLNWYEKKHQATLYPLVQGLIASSVALSLSADLFNLYVWFELMLMSVLGLILLGGGRQHTEAAFKYFSISMLGTLLMLTAIGLIQGATGHLNFSALREIAQQPDMSEPLTLFSGLLFAALLLKLGAFPLFSWIPAAYHTLSAPLLALVGGLLTKISVYVMLRLSGQILDGSALHLAIGWLAVITMISGVLGAAYHWDLRRILAFHIISQVGFMLLGIALASPAGDTGTVVFLFHNILVKANLFLIAGLAWWSLGHYDLRRIGGLFKANPWLSAAFLISAMSLVGVPPSSGFWGKFLLLQETFVQKHYIWGGLALLTGLLTLYSMSKIWLECFWKPLPANNVVKPIPWPLMTTILMMTAVIILFGLFPEPLISTLQTHADFWRIK